MMGLGDANLRVRPAGLLTAVHERDHASQVGLIGEELQVVEQLHVRLESFGHTRRLIDVWAFFGALFFSLLDPALDVTERLEIVVHLPGVRRAEFLLKLPHAGGHRIEDAPVLTEASCPYTGIGAVARSEQSLENDARIVFRHQRQRWREPRQRAAVRTAVA